MSAGADQAGADEDGRRFRQQEALARRVVLARLAAQARSRDELVKTLASRGVDQDVIDLVLSRMAGVGLVDDAAFARDWVALRQPRRHLSRAALRRELLAKGVVAKDIDDALSQIDTDDEVAAARALAEKKLRSCAGLDRAVCYRRTAGALARRGFGRSVIARVLAEVLPGGDVGPPAAGLPDA